MGNSLLFFNISKGKIVSSQKQELYTTFQELRKNQPFKNKDQLSDMWLVAKLQQHYWMINRRQRKEFWDLFRMKTVGFATFIRVGTCPNTLSCEIAPSYTKNQFERTIKKGEDPSNFIVTARVPAISSGGGEAVSNFLYSMRHPLRDAKMMLLLLDRLAGTTKNDKDCFYVVEIKETFDTR
jgi:hypothetical protein